MPAQTFTNRPTNNGQTTGFAVRGGVGIGWPTERWVGVLVLLALALLILIRFGFRGIGLSGNVSGGVKL